MLCSKPFTKGVSSYGCGQCMPCRFNTVRVWKHRLMLEAAAHPAASFVTLTYDEEHLPSDGSVNVRDLQLFMKRIRKIVPLSLRFYGVGEYGDWTNRPHYHLALYGIGPEHASYVARAWTAGFVYVGDLTVHSAGYIAGYVTKKMTRKDDPRLHGRYPEFARMSLRPGIGAPVVGQVAASLQSHVGWDLIGRRGDVPEVLSHGRVPLPLGRYLRSRLRSEMLDVADHEAAKNNAASVRQKELLAVYASYLTPEEAKEGNKKLVYGKLRYVEAQRARTLAQLNRTRIKLSRKGVGL